MSEFDLSIRRAGRNRVPKALACAFVSLYGLGLVPGRQAPEMPRKVLANAANVALILEKSIDTTSQKNNPVDCIGVQVIPVKNGDTLSGIQEENIKGSYSDIASASQPLVIRLSGVGAGIVNYEEPIMPGDLAIVERVCGEIQDNEIVVNQ